MDPPAPTHARLLTPPGRGGIAVVGVWGPGRIETLRGIFRPQHPGPLLCGRLHLGRLHDCGAVVDEVVLAVGPAQVEVNLHGGPQAVRATMELLAARGVSIDPPDGGPPSLPHRHPRWDNPAIGQELLEHLPRAQSLRVAAVLANQWSAGLSELASDASADPSALLAAADGLQLVQRLLEPPDVVLAGPPNAGKSSLANALVGREVAIVHDRPGTTRDWVREPAILDGLPVWITDTAGIWDAPGDIDAQAVQRARQRARQADLVLLLSPGEWPDVPDWLAERPVLRVASQCDMARPQGVASQCDAARPQGVAGVVVSARTGEGLAALTAAVLHRLGLTNLDVTAPRAFTARQADLLARAARAPGRNHELLSELLTGSAGTAP